MMKRNRLWKVTLGALIAAVLLSVGSAYARYHEELVGDQSFQVKPAEQMAFASEQWQTDEDGNRVLTFSMANTVENGRVYLAVSQGVTAPETLQVALTLPVEDGTEAEAVTLRAKGQKITPETSLYSVFGPGYVFRFYDTAEQQDSVEKALDLKREAVYTLTVSGLASATEQASLLRLFVDYT